MADYFYLQNEKITLFSMCLETYEENLRLETMEELFGPFKIFLIGRIFVLCMTEMYFFSLNDICFVTRKVRAKDKQHL